MVECGRWSEVCEVVASVDDQMCPRLLPSSHHGFTLDINLDFDIPLI